MNTKRKLCAILAAVITAGALPLHVMAAKLPFKDVPTDAWYYTDVKLAYENGLINGRDIDKFEPDGYLTYAEAIKLAACMHRNATNGPEIEVVTGYDWYIPYVEYSKKAGIIFRDYNWSADIPRAEYMDIFARALPAKMLPEINKIPYGAVPDVSVGHRYAYSIYFLYRAGILQGRDDELTFYPNKFVERSEVAAVLTRMTDKTKRLKITSTAKETSVKPLILPWEVGGKHPKEYALEDFEALTEEQRAVFLQCEPESPAYKAWLAKENAPETEAPIVDETEAPVIDETEAPVVDETKPPVDDKVDETEGKEDEPVHSEPVETEAPAQNGQLPWEPEEGRDPFDYTLEEYNRLSDEQKEIFRDSFANPSQYDLWLVKVGLREPDGSETFVPEEDDSGIVVIPWDVEGAKPHSSYTKEDYDKLSAQMQELFLMFFPSPEAREAWMIQYGLMEAPEEEAPPEDDFSGGFVVEEIPWEKDGAKQPEEYTWAEYERLTPFQKEVFRDSFFLPEEFDAWMEKNAR